MFEFVIKKCMVLSLLYFIINADIWLSIKATLFYIYNINLVTIRLCQKIGPDGEV